MHINYSVQRFFVKFVSNFIFNSKKKKTFKKELLDKITENEYKNTRWGVSYSVYDGVELLEASIRNIRESVDYINVVYQLKSWYGAEAEQELYPLLLKLKDEGLIDELIEFKPNYKIKPRTNEDIKRRLGLKYARRAHLDYFMTMDADEFYIKEEFEQAKKTILEKGIESAFCPIVDYGLKPTRRVIRNAPYAVQFFFKLTPFSHLGKNKNAIAIADTTRTLAKPFFFENVNQCMCLDVEMHHMSWVRHDLASKFQNSSGRSDINFVLDDEFYKNCDKNCVDCKDIFNLAEIFSV